MSFDPIAYKENLKKKINERYSIKEVSPTDINQTDLGLDGGQGQAQPQAPAPTAPQGQAPQPKAKDPEISMEVLRGTVQWALGEKDGGKSSDEIVNQLAAMKKPGLIDFIHSYLDGSGQQAQQSTTPDAQPTGGEPAQDDLSGLTQPETPPADTSAPPADQSTPPEDTSGADDFKL